jgi:hypothetical protein
LKHSFSPLPHHHHHDHHYHHFPLHKSPSVPTFSRFFYSPMVWLFMQPAVQRWDVHGMYMGCTNLIKSQVNYKSKNTSGSYHSVLISLRRGVSTSYSRRHLFKSRPRDRIS